MSQAPRSLSQVLLYSVLLILSVYPICLSAQINEQLAPTSVPGPARNSLELEAITWSGCSGIQPQQLLGVIQSRESELSLTRQLALYYYENLKRNPATPPQMMRTLTGVQHDLREELRYFNPHVAEDDSAAIVRFYDVNGYHQATVTWNFGYVRSTDKNTLSFTVQEGPRAIIDSILIVGLDSLPVDVQQAIQSVRTVKSNSPFSEADLEADFRSMVKTLQYNGYYLAGYERPTVIMSADKLHDSVAVIFRTGPRKRIGTIVFEENTAGYGTITESMKQRQLEFSVGEWYNADLIEKSRTNLINLSVFETVIIDTVASEVLDSTFNPITDSNLAIRVFTKCSKPYDVGANLLLYQTAIDNYLNFGVGLTALHRNAFGGAQTASVTAQYVLQDISRVFQNQPLLSEALLSGVLGWPSIFRLWDWRAGLQLNTYYSLRLLVSPFRLESFGVGGRLPVNLPATRVVNGFDVTASVERQLPRNFEQALDSALADAPTKEDSSYVLSTYNQFLVLDNYLNGAKRFFTGIYAGLNIRGEHRDNPVDPRKGNFFNLSAEVGFGAGRFVRSQFFYTQLIPSSEHLTFATKVKIGHIQLLDFTRGSNGADTNTYVPLDRQFFAGGAASIRSYPSRLLHDPRSGVITSLNPSQSEILANVVGSASLLELSFESRYRFPKPTGMDEFWASIIARSGITVFADYGNAFNRMTKDLYGAMRFSDLIEGSVLAAGVGYRFETPVGPFRVDFATSVYDPLRSEGQWITNRKLPFSTSNWYLSLGLGHAF